MELKDLKSAIETTLQEVDQLRDAKTTLEGTIEAKQQAINEQQVSINTLQNQVQEKAQSLAAQAVKLSAVEKQVQEKVAIISQQEQKNDELEKKVEYQAQTITTQAVRIEELEKLVKDPPDTTPIKELFFSVEKLSLSDFIVKAQGMKATAVIDMDTVIDKTITIEGECTLISKNRAVISNKTPMNLFALGDGDHVFEGFDIVQNEAGIAFGTIVGKNIWNNVIRNVNVTGGRQAYASSRGGIYDATKDEVIIWAGTTIEDCVFKTSFVCVSNFSQDGPGKYLHMKKVDLYSDTSHNIYAHPNVSLQFDTVRSMKIGPTAVALHHFSGGGGEGGKGAISNARYVELRNCTTNWQPDMKGGMWQIAEPITGAVIMDSCDLAPYSIPQPNMIANNTRFFNGGGGAFVKGELRNCSGAIIPVNGTKVIGGNFAEVSMQGGSVEFVDAKIGDFFSAKVGFTVTLKNTTVAAMSLNNTFENKVKMDADSKIIAFKWNWKAPAGVIEELKMAQ